MRPSPRYQIYLDKPMFRCVLTILILAAGLAAADGKSKAGSRDAAPPPSPPATAREVEPGTFEYKDPQGRLWIYKRTPFGWSRYTPDQKTEAQPEPPSGITAHEEGDNVRFERRGPFGVSRWVRKKSELNEEERLIWEKAKRDSAAPAKAPRKQE